MATVVIECEDRFAEAAFDGARKGIREADIKEREDAAKAILEKAMKDIDDLGIKLCHLGGSYVCANEHVEMNHFRFFNKR